VPFGQSEPTRTVVNTTRHVEHKTSTVLADKTNLPLASSNRTLELFPEPWEKYSGLLPGYTLNNCILWIRSLTVIHDVFQE
jgi:hypothetical protein